MTKATPNQPHNATSEIPEKTPIENLFMEMKRGEGADTYALANLAQTTRLAAFAAEARRTLTGIEEVMQYHPEAKKTIGAMVPAWRQWSGMDDATGLVLSNIADSMDDLAEAIQKRTADQEARFRLVKRTN